MTVDQRKDRLVEVLKSTYWDGFCFGFVVGGGLGMVAGALIAGVLSKA